MYDRSALVAAARAVERSTDTALTTLVARRLGIARNTAWRLLQGRTIPSGEVAAAVETAYGVPASALVERAA